MNDFAQAAAADLMLDPARIEAYRLLLRASGFVPVPVIGKRPVMDGWQRLGGATEHEVRRWTRTRSAETNTGILTRLNPAVDLDIHDEEGTACSRAAVRRCTAARQKSCANSPSAPRPSRKSSPTISPRPASTTKPSNGGARRATKRFAALPSRRRSLISVRRLPGRTTGRPHQPRPRRLELARPPSD